MAESGSVYTSTCLSDTFTIQYTTNTGPRVHAQLLGAVRVAGRIRHFDYKPEFSGRWVVIGVGRLVAAREHRVRFRFAVRERDRELRAHFPADRSEPNQPLGQFGNCVRAKRVVRHFEHQIAFDEFDRLAVLENAVSKQFVVLSHCEAPSWWNVCDPARHGSFSGVWRDSIAARARREARPPFADTARGTYSSSTASTKFPF